MKRSSIGLFVAGFAVMMLAIGISVPAQAAWSPQVKGGEEVTIAEGETHEGSLYATGKNVVIAGDVEGSVYCAASEKVEITGTVQGSVYCAAAQEIILNGEVTQGARLASLITRVDGEVGGDLSLAAQQAELSNDTRVAGDVNGYAQNLTIGGEVGGGLRLSAQAITLNGVVQGASDISTESLTFGDNGKFASDLFYTSTSEITIDRSLVAGQIDYNENASQSASGDQMLATLLLLVGSFLFAGLAIVVTLPQFVERSSRLVKGKIGVTLLAGSAVLFVAPVAMFLFFISYFGTFLAFILLLVWLAILLLSGVFFAYYLGTLILQNSQNIILRMLAGLVLLAALWLIPGVQIIAIIATALVGSGILVRALFEKQFDGHRYTTAPLPPRPAMPISLGGSGGSHREEKAHLETPAPIAEKPAKKPAAKKAEQKSAEPKKKPAKKSTKNPAKEPDKK